MRIARAALVAAALVLGIAPAAWGLSGPPRVFTFDDVPRETQGPQIYPNDFVLAQCATIGAPTLPRSPDQILDLLYDPVEGCPGTVQFRTPQAFVGAFMRTGAFTGGASVTVTFTDVSGQPMPREVALSTTEWTPVSAVLPRGRAIAAFGVNRAVQVDDLAISTDPQPDTAIVSGPPTVGGSTADFSFNSSDPAAAFFCKLDGGASAPCSSPYHLDGLSAGNHVLTVWSRNVYGLDDASPATYTWQVAAGGGAADRDRDGVPDAGDNCPDAANANQADADKDQIGDACETLPSGNLKPQAGKRATVKLLSGEVFVRLPATRGATARLHTARRLAEDGAPAGFVPLKGNASLPVGSVVDARHGSLAVTAAAEFGGSATQQASVQAGMFQIRQQRARRQKQQRHRRATTDFLLRTPVGAARTCTSRTGSRRTIVRTFRGRTSKGLFRTFGGASVTTVSKGTWRTSDRCDGTLTEIGNCRAIVFDRVKGRSVPVKAGQAYLVRSPIFTAKKGRLLPPPAP